MTKEQLAKILSHESQSSLSSQLDILAERELEVFSVLGQGYSPSQIEAELGIDQRQLRALKQSIRAKLGLKDDVQLLRLAAQQSRVP